MQGKHDLARFSSFLEDGCAQVQHHPMTRALKGLEKKNVCLFVILCIIKLLHSVIAPVNGGALVYCVYRYALKQTHFSLKFETCSKDQCIFLIKTIFLR